MNLCLTVVIPKNPSPASDVNTEKSSILSTKTVLEHQPWQRGRKPGKKRGRTPKILIPHPTSTPSKSAEPLKFPKKRGPKPGSKVGKTWTSQKEVQDSKEAIHPHISSQKGAHLAILSTQLVVFKRNLDCHPCSALIWSLLMLEIEQQGQETNFSF